MERKFNKLILFFRGAKKERWEGEGDRARRAKFLVLTKSPSDREFIIFFFYTSVVHFVLLSVSSSTIFFSYFVPANVVRSTLEVFSGKILHAGAVAYSEVESQCSDME